jgi:hypothetical protein
MSNIFYSDTSELKTCPRVEFSSLLFSIKHEKSIDLKKYKLVLHFNGYTVYNGPYQEEIKLFSKICSMNSQQIVIILYDNKEYFSWHKKSAYSLTNKNNSKVEINLLSKSNFSKSTGDEYEISFK